MPGRDSCYAIVCANWREKVGFERGKFYRIPIDKDASLVWIRRINKLDLGAGDLSENTRLSCAHFHNGVQPNNFILLNLIINSVY